MEKEIRFVFTRHGGLGVELDEDIQKISSSKCKTNQH